MFLLVLCHVQIQYSPQTSDDKAGLAHTESFGEQNKLDCLQSAINKVMMQLHA